MNEDRLSHLIYSSTALPGLEPSALASILQVARGNNARQGVTGMLLFAAGTFFQVLEGDDAALQSLFATIKADPRHGNVTMIINEPIAGRVFGDWTMGFAEMDARELEHLEGVSDFFQQDNPLDGLRPGRARKVLTAFAQGRWRARLA